MIEETRCMEHDNIFVRIRYVGGDGLTQFFHIQFEIGKYIVYWQSWHLTETRMAKMYYRIGTGMRSGNLKVTFDFTLEFQYDFISCAQQRAEFAMQLNGTHLIDTTASIWCIAKDVQFGWCILP